MAEQRGFGDFGYRKSTGEYVSALQDMIDGGGAGRSGEEFEGGGILSLLANLLFSPRGSRGEPMRPRSRPSGGSSPTSGGTALAVESSPRPRSRPLPAGTLPGGMEFASEEFLQNIDPTARRTAVGSSPTSGGSALASESLIGTQPVAPAPQYAATGLNLIRNGFIQADSPTFFELVEMINSRGTAAQRAELAQYLP